MNKNLPLVCICVPTYNAAGTVRETLESILSQTYKNLVVHVSDNASTDSTLSIIESMADPRIVIHRNNENVGGEGNFNRCIQIAEGKYTAIFHADDLYEPAMVERQVDFLEQHGEAGAVFTEASIIDETGRRRGAIRLPKELKSEGKLFGFLQLFKLTLHRHNFFICPSAMIRTDVLKNEIKRWRSELFKSSSDLDMWLRISQHHAVGFLPMPLMRYRISQFQFSAQVRRQIERADFFLVTDYYLSQDEVQCQLNGDDLMHYQWLEHIDRVRRALSLYALDRAEEATQLCGKVLTVDVVRAALDNKRSLLALFAGIFIKLFTAIRLQSLGKLILKHARK